MLYERQRRLLTLLETVGEPLSHTKFQKLLFLYTRECEVTPSYDFVPYKFGAFSFTSYADRRKLIAEGLLLEDERVWMLTDPGREEARRHAVEPLKTAGFCNRYSRLRSNALIVEQYRSHPYYATRSEILGKLRLDAEALARIAAAKPKRKPPGIVTIGYQGRSIESYLNELLHNGATLLCDVRRNSLSHKYGFSKNTLRHACEGVGIRYEHLPQLGIASDKRIRVRTEADYHALFAEYERETLPRQRAGLERILSWLAAGERIALTCFEREPQRCHRHCVAEALERMSGVELIVHHL